MNNSTQPEPAASKADTRPLLYALAQLHQDIGAVRRELMRQANDGAGLEWLECAAAIESSLRKTEAILGRYSIALIVAEKPERTS